MIPRHEMRNRSVPNSKIATCVFGGESGKERFHHEGVPGRLSDSITNLYETSHFGQMINADLNVTGVGDPVNRRDSRCGASSFPTGKAVMLRIESLPLTAT